MSKRRIVLLLSVAVALAGVLAACAAPAATAQPTTITTAPPTVTTAPPTAEPEASLIDQVVAAILAQDVEATRALIHFTTAGCTKADGLGGPPKCVEGQAEGAPVEFLPVLGPGEGSTVLAEDVENVLPLAVSELVAVYAVPEDAYQDPVWPAGDYGLVFASSDEFLKTITVLVSDAGIVRINHHMESPEDVIAASGGTLIER